MKVSEKIDVKSVIKRNGQLLFSDMDGEVVMLSIQNSEYYGMDKIGSRIWEMIEQPIKVEDLIDLLLEEYDVGKKECENDVLAYLNELEQKQVITPVKSG